MTNTFSMRGFIRTYNEGNDNENKFHPTSELCCFCHYLDAVGNLLQTTNRQFWKRERDTSSSAECTANYKDGDLTKCGNNSA